MESKNADVKWQRRLRVCWRDRDVLRYLSPAGKRLHQGLQIVLAVALVYCVMQHVVFADDQELFEGGADVGDLLFNFAAAYVVTYVFYVLVVRIPLVRDRRNIYPYLGPLIRQVADLANDLIVALNKVAGFDSSRVNTLTNVEETCRKINPNAQTRMSFDIAVTGGTVKYFGDVVTGLHTHMKYALQLNQEILAFATYVPSEIVGLISLIENKSHFESLRSFPEGHPSFGYPDDLSLLSGGLFNYLVFADRLDVDHGKFLPDAPDTPAYLRAAYEQGDTYVPLRRFVVSRAPAADAVQSHQAPPVDEIPPQAGDGGN